MSYLKLYSQRVDWLATDVHTRLKKLEELEEFSFGMDKYLLQDDNSIKALVTRIEILEKRLPSVEDEALVKNESNATEAPKPARSQGEQDEQDEQEEEEDE